MTQQLICPCGSGLNFNQCCDPCLSGHSPAKTADQLMRSRYTAYVLQNEAYLLATWHISNRPSQLNLQDKPTHWIGLKLISTQAGQAKDTKGMVEFIARYKLNGKAHRLHEKSHFIKQGGHWFYVEGESKA